MDDGMMGMPDPATPGQGQPNPPPAGGGMGGGWAEWAATCDGEVSDMKDKNQHHTWMFVGCILFAAVTRRVQGPSASQGVSTDGPKVII